MSILHPSKRSSSPLSRSFIPFLLLIVLLLVSIPASLAVADGPTQQERTIFKDKLERFEGHKELAPHPVDDVLDSIDTDNLTEGKQITVEIDCPEGSQYETVTVKIATALDAWAEEEENLPPSKIGGYFWKPQRQTINGKHKTIEFKNSIALDPEVTSEQEQKPPLGPIDDETLLYHELLHGQLLIDAMKSDGDWQQEVCNCKLDYGPMDADHERIPEMEANFLEELGQEHGLDIIKVKEEKDGEDETKFTKRFAIPEDKLEQGFDVKWTGRPKGNIVSVNLSVEGDELVVEIEVADPTKTTVILVYIDPPTSGIIYHLILNGTPGSTDAFGLPITSSEFITTIPGSWNLFSSPGIPVNPDPSVALADDLGCAFTLYYDYSPVDGYTEYTSGIDTHQLTWQHGYWVQVNEETQMDMEVDIPTQDYTLEGTTEGWKMIGVPYPVDWSQVNFPDPSDFETDGAGHVRIVRWIGSGQYYMNHYSNSQYVLSPWSGYWINVVDASPGDPASLTISKSDQPSSPLWLQLVLPQSIDPDQLDYPPIPPKIKASSLAVFAYPNPVTKEEQIIFSVQSLDVQEVKVVVMDTSGKPVYDSGYNVGSELTWNLEDSTGDKVTNGIYLYQVRVKGATGKTRDSEVKRLLVVR